MAKPDDVVVRARRDDDLDACVKIATALRALDGYPPYLPDDDVRAPLTRALDRRIRRNLDGGIVGHIALHSSRTNAAVDNELPDGRVLREYVFAPP